MLNRAGLGREDHFFASGGNSLAAVQAAALSPINGRSISRYVACSKIQGCMSARQKSGRFYLQEAPGGTASISILPTPGTRVNSSPLSFAQQRQWFLWQLDPSSTAYHIKHALRLSGSLDTQALRSFKGLVERHESLRTMFRPGARWIG